MGHMRLRVAVNVAQHKIVSLLKTLWDFLWLHVTVYLMCGPRQLFFHCGPEKPKGWTPLLGDRVSVLRKLPFRRGIAAHSLGHPKPSTLCKWTKAVHIESICEYLIIHVTICKKSIQISKDLLEPYANYWFGKLIEQLLWVLRTIIDIQMIRQRASSKESIWQ